MRDFPFPVSIQDCFGNQRGSKESRDRKLEEYRIKERSRYCTNHKATYLCNWNYFYHMDTQMSLFVAVAACIHYFSVTVIKYPEQDNL